MKLTGIVRDTFVRPTVPLLGQDSQDFRIYRTFSENYDFTDARPPVCLRGASAAGRRSPPAGGVPAPDPSSGLSRRICRQGGNVTDRDRIAGFFSKSERVSESDAGTISRQRPIRFRTWTPLSEPPRRDGNDRPHRVRIQDGRSKMAAGISYFGPVTRKRLGISKCSRGHFRWNDRSPIERHRPRSDPASRFQDGGRNRGTCRAFTRHRDPIDPDPRPFPPVECARVTLSRP